MNTEEINIELESQIEDMPDTVKCRLENFVSPRLTDVRVDDPSVGSVRYFTYDLIEQYWQQWQPKLNEHKKFCKEYYGFILLDSDWFRSRFNEDFKNMPVEHYGIWLAIIYIHKNDIQADNKKLSHLSGRAAVIC